MVPVAMDTTAEGMGYAELRAALDRQPLFEDKTWRLSPQAWPLTAQEVAQLQRIGEALLEFYKAVEQLYLRSAQGKNLLRNRPLTAPWVVDYYDRGKPPSLVAHARSARLRGTVPPVLRPDLLLTDDGFALTETDSVPGGIGLTAFLNRLFERAGGAPVLGAGDRMVEAFYDSLASQVPAKRLPVIAIVVSEEAATYRPEMEWLAAALQRLGRRVYCLRPEQVFPLGQTLCTDVGGNPEQIDLIYRFWELFDIASVPLASHLLEAWAESQVVVAPPMRPFQEEKLSLALFHHHLLEEFWKENLSKGARELLGRLIPKSWLVDKVELPPGAVLDGPTIGGKPIWRWEQLADATQKERNLILKISGFHESAWGARSVLLGSDIPRHDWLRGLQRALELAHRHPHVLQEYHKPKRLAHPVYGLATPHALAPMEGRTRLCPYYFVVNGRVELAGCLATFCPADKKIIHGMKDAAMLPCAVVEGA